MRLHDFILRNMETILARWEEFAARQLPAAASMQPLALRDHAEQILQAIATDLLSYQSREAQLAKSQGLKPVLAGAPETAAQTHAILRAKSGFNVTQLTAEYRALRASVLRMWTDAHPLSGTEQLEDIMRFNEAIDQALAESIGFFILQVEQARNLLLGMLGHDLRTPLQSIQMTARYLAELNAGADVSIAAARLINSGARMHALLDDLMDFSRTRLGLGIKVNPAPMDAASAFADELGLVRAAHPGHRIDIEAAGDTTGNWDAMRLRQVLSNLVVNAIKYGGSDEPVRIRLEGTAAELRFEVSNEGPTIEASMLLAMFDPLRRGVGADSAADDGLGLGLFIAREVLKAHGGDIEARSQETLTVFSARIPRQAQPHRGPRAPATS